MRLCVSASLRLKASYRSRDVSDLTATYSIGKSECSLACSIDGPSAPEARSSLTVMKDSLSAQSSRRRFLKTTAAVSALAGVKIPFVHAVEDNATKVALVGAGGRGTGAAANALSVSGPPIKLVAVADVQENKLKASLSNLKSKFQDQVDVPPDRQFVSFDGYKNAIDSVDKNGVVIFTTPPAFRWVHFKYAIDKGVNVFMEKPVCTDGPS